MALPFPAAVICDLDGTLVDTVATRITAWLRTFAEFDLPADHDHVAGLIGADGRWLAKRVAERAARSLDGDLAERIDRRAGELYGQLNRDPRPLPGVGRFVAALADRDIPWAIATSSRPEQVAVSVAALGLDAPPVVVDGMSVARAKPDPDLLLTAARALGRPAIGCWSVGDSVWDVRAGFAAGMVPVAVTTGSATADALEAAGAARIVADLGALVDEL